MAQSLKTRLIIKIIKKKKGKNIYLLCDPYSRPNNFLVADLENGVVLTKKVCFEMKRG